MEGYGLGIGLLTGATMGHYPPFIGPCCPLEMPTATQNLEVAASRAPRQRRVKRASYYPNSACKEGTLSYNPLSCTCMEPGDTVCIRSLRL